MDSYQHYGYLLVEQNYLIKKNSEGQFKRSFNFDNTQIDC